MTLNRRIHHVFRPLVAALALALAVVLVMQTSGYSVTSARVQAVERVAGTSTKHPASLKQVARERRELRLGPTGLPAGLHNHLSLSCRPGRMYLRRGQVQAHAHGDR